MRGPNPLLFVTLPETPFWNVIVLPRAEPVILAGSNPIVSMNEEERAIEADSRS